MKPNLIVTVTGGRHSGKSELANTILKSLRKSAKYGTQLEDGDVKLPADQGPTQVLIQTVEYDEMLDEGFTMEGPENLHITQGSLKAAFLVWELERRLGKCKSTADIDSLPAGQVAEEAASTLWKILNTK